MKKKIKLTEVYKRTLLSEAKCPKCGSDGAYVGLSNVECKNPNCINFKKSDEPSGADNNNSAAGSEKKILFTPDECEEIELTLTANLDTDFVNHPDETHDLINQVLDKFEGKPAGVKSLSEEECDLIEKLFQEFVDDAYIQRGLEQHEEDAIKSVIQKIDRKINV